MNATPSGPSTRCASATLFTCCTPFRRNRRKVSPRLGKKSSSSNNGSLRQNGTIERGTTEMKKDNQIRVKESSGNVFADLGFPNPEREQLKARLTLEIYRLIKDRGPRLDARAVRQLLRRAPYGFLDRPWAGR